jgi:hypothetical protein
MPMGKGTYGSKRGRPSNAAKAKAKTMSPAAKARMMKMKKGRK